IGTAKATPEEQARVPHHLLDILDPDETLGAAEFQQMGYDLVDDVLARGKVPFVVGGTGQYVMAVIEGWQIPRVPPQEDLREELYAYAEDEGHEALHARLQALDPVAAGRIDARNVRRVVRALEVCLVSGRPISEQQGKQPPPYRILVLGLERPRDVLYDRIDRRIDAMIEEGLEEEVRALVAASYSFDLPSMSGLGYGQFEPYLAAEISLDDVVAEIARQTRRFVRQQANWFRDDDPRIRWLDMTEDVYDEALDLVRRFLTLPSVADPRPRDPVDGTGGPEASP
ncbi:MAG TPA: tRNA (adenosine(37)-N6)-dimethylallyltransferase MiaA, partial [Anaerolineae bacterium]|nr:tRNA (adenosine(37)-N6)-dimethylallyltransferase MiaA [Anaerolineae bacterium]